MKLFNIGALAACLLPFATHAQDVADYAKGTVRRTEIEVAVPVDIKPANTLLEVRADNSNPMVEALMASIGLFVIDLSDVPAELVCKLSVYPESSTTVIAFNGTPIIILTFPIGQPVETIQGLIDLGILILPDEATASCVGDPHFVTWSGKRFNFQGECDLVLAHAPNFQGGKGLDVHVRTKIESIYSIVAAAAIKVGDSVLEFNHEVVGERNFLVDGVGISSLPFSNGAFAVTGETQHNDDHDIDVAVYTIDLGHGTVVKIDVFAQWVMVSMTAHGLDILDTTGLAGNYPYGAMLSRDGVTDLSDDRDAFGLEWQVQENDPQLFHSTPEGHPVAPYAACKMPEEDAHEYLRSKSSGTYRKAWEACVKEGVSGPDLNDCVFDVAVLNDVKFAGAWWSKEQIDGQIKTQVEAHVETKVEKPGTEEHAEEPGTMSS